MAEQDPQQEERPTEPCAWCGEPSVTRIILTTGKRSKRSPVCRSHEQQFVRHGAESERTLSDKKYGKSSTRPVIK